MEVINTETIQLVLDEDERAGLCVADTGVLSSYRVPIVFHEVFHSFTSNLLVP